MIEEDSQDEEVTILLSISDYGLEYFEDVTEIMSKEALDLAFTIKLVDNVEDQKLINFQHRLVAMNLRARMNSHRNYESYILRTPRSCVAMLDKALTSNNEMMKKLVKQRGVKI